MDKNIKLNDGRLLLIENDAGYISPDNNQEIISEMKKIDFSDDIILFGILQKFNTPNKNGRVYPEQILKREVDKYQKLIQNGGALSELNHPSCQKPDAQILTKDGWKELQHINDDEEVFTLTNTGDIELKRIYEKVVHPYKGKMIHLKGHNIDVSVTPNHKFPVINKKGEQSFITVQEIFDSFKMSNKLSKLYIPRLFKGSGDDYLYVTTKKVKGVYLDNRYLSLTEEDYDGFVYSVDVPNHTYYTKYNEKCHWTGNSNLVDLDRISHSITETWWDGEILMGKLKLFTSPGWKKMGIVSTKGDQAAMLIMNGATLGISSRGVGSLKKDKNVNIVQSDFELVCFDLVSNPSTPGAYVFADLNDKDKFNEATEVITTDKTVSLMNKLNNFLSKR